MFKPSESHWVFPGIYKERVTRKQLREVLLQPDPFINGHFYEWHTAHKGVGIYDLWVEIRRMPNNHITVEGDVINNLDGGGLK